MFFNGAVLAACLSVVGAYANVHPRQGASPIAQNVTGIEPKRFIVEFAKGADHAALKSQIAARTGVKILKTFNSDLFSGVSVETEKDNADTLFTSNDAVSKVYVSTRLAIGDSVAQTFADDAAAPKYSIHQMTGVDKVHAAGHFGKGAVVAVVDTGIAYDHPALGGGFGPGFKVAGGYDFIGNSTYPFGGVKMPDDDPYDQRGHGTHVAGTIAGKSDRFVGVAPEATLLAYKVFGQLDGVWDSDLMEAFIKAEEDGADIITASIIGYGGWASAAWAVLASRLVEKGVVVTIAGGNWGAAGPFFFAHGSSGDLVLGVASVDADQQAFPAFEATFTQNGVSNTTKVAYYSDFKKEWSPSVSNLPIVPFSGDMTITDEACQPLPATTRNLTGEIVLVRRASACRFEEQQYNLEQFGAQYILFFNSDWQALAEPFTYNPSLCALIEARAGAAIINAVQAGVNVTASFTETAANTTVGMFDPAGYNPSDFSSWGSLYDLQLKPDIAAPGGNIFSTYMEKGYSVQSGTSMACPYVAGVAALYIGRYGGRKVHGPGFGKDLTGRIIAAGQSVKSADKFGWASTMQVGNGIINAEKLVLYDTSLSYAKFAVNDTAHFSRYHSVDVRNAGTKPVTYTFEVQDAAGYKIWEPKVEGTPCVGCTGYPGIRDGQRNPPSKMVPDVTMPGGTFTVNPGESKTAKFSFKPMSGGSEMPAFSGKILIKGSNGEEVSVPYFGIGSDVKQEVGDVFPNDYPKAWSGWDWPYPFLNEKNNFTFNLARDVGDFPRIHARYLWGTQEIRWDIFEAGWTERKWNTYPPVVGENGYLGSVAVFAEAGSDYNNFRFDPAKHNETNTYSFPIQDQVRSATITFDQEYWWLGRFANQSRIAPGDYVMRFAVLKPFGSKQRGDNWGKVLYPFTVLPPVS